MGDIADAMIDGTLDCITGEYIGKPVGYPRSNYKRYKKPYTKADVIRLIVNRTLKKELLMEDAFNLMWVWINTEVKEGKVTCRPMPTTKKERVAFTLEFQQQFKKWLLSERIK